MLGFTMGNRPQELFLLAISLMMIFSVLSSKASSLLGVPSLLLFLFIGMLAGSEGPGGIDFTNYSLTFMVGSISLAFILFDGGMKTSWKKIQPVFWTGASLSSLGVLFTCLLIAWFGHYVLKISPIESLLFGAIISSTDAAAVFSILRSKQLALKGRLRMLLELEAGSNDPMAIFLTMGFLQLASNPSNDLLDLLWMFLLQTGIGAVFGYAGGKLMVWFLNRIRIDYDGLYPVLLISLIMLVFSSTSALKGSGFFAVYIAGIIIGNASVIRKKSLLLFQDGVAWMSQITLFLFLGLLVFPSHLISVWKEGILMALFMMFVARPLSVFLAAPRSGLKLKERIFISWVGLRGAAPIILAILPWSVQYPQAEYFFNIVFFMVLFSVLLQGPTIPWLARKLEVSEEKTEEGISNVAILPKGFIDIDIFVHKNFPAEGKRLVELQLPPGVILVSIERKNRFIIPRGETRFEVHDKINALGRSSNMSQLKELFGHCELSK